MTDEKPTEDEAESKPTEQWLVWDHNFAFETREMRPKDWGQFGASLDEDALAGPSTEWTQANNWRVPRADIPLTDLQLGTLMGVDSSFRLVDAG